MPPYVDGHQHVHVYPRFAEAIAMVLQEYGITKTRFPSEDMDEVGWMNDNPRKPFRQTVYRNVLLFPPSHSQTLQACMAATASAAPSAGARSLCSTSSTAACATLDALAT